MFNLSHIFGVTSSQLVPEYASIRFVRKKIAHSIVVAFQIFKISTLAPDDISVIDSLIDGHIVLNSNDYLRSSLLERCCKLRRERLRDYSNFKR
jgi:hypothetical protein